MCYSQDDINLKPTFDLRQSIILEVPENTTVGSSLEYIRASDADNDSIVFSLDSASQGVLKIDNTGNLTLEAPLDREVKNIHDFVVYVADICTGCILEDRKTSRSFKLFVIDVNDNKPTFISTPYLARVAENETVGDLVIQVSAIDRDTGRNALVSYMFSPSTKTDTFAIDNHLGKITINGSLDFEKVQRYTLFVTAKDGGDPPLESKTTVIVDVSDVSDNPPSFLRPIYLESIPENKPKGSSIVQVQAVDGDSGVGNAVEYEIIDGNDEGLFDIDKSSGNITVNGTIDAEKTDFFRITVKASEVVDPASNSTAVVLVTVLDTNDNSPQFLQNRYDFNIREDLAQPGYVITNQLNVQDKDIYPQNRRFQYSLSGEDSKYFTIDQSSGLLRVNATLDYEQHKANFSFKVFANESESEERLSGFAIVEVDLININDNEPKFNQSSYNFTYDEEIHEGFVIGTVMATDADLGSYGEIKYELYGTGAASFTVDSSNGSIRASKVLDYEQNKEFMFFLLANDGGRFYEEDKTYVTTIRVFLRDVNDNDPVFLKTPYAVDIMENQTENLFVYQVSASDLDSGENARISFNITDGNSGNAFAINESGMVTTTLKLDREKVPSYSLTIMAYDHGDPSTNTTTILAVTVLDINDNPPVIFDGPYLTANVSEGKGGGTIVYTFRASDQDEGRNKKLTYAISAGQNGEFILNSNTGVLQISPTGLDRELHSSYNLTINVTDGGIPMLWGYSMLHIKILDINDNSPEFVPSPSGSLSTYIRVIDEGADSINKAIIDVNATDKDDGTNSKIVYTFSGDQHGYFHLNSSMGVLYVRKVLDRENSEMTLDAQERGVFSLDITATDQAEPENTRKSSTVRVTIIVNDINDNTPQFVDPPQSTSISEAARPGSNVIQVPAVDKDLGFAGKVFYNITEGNSNGNFEITPGGYILVKRSLDAEVKSLYNLTIEAKDEGQPKRSNKTVVSIVVDDVNDNDPVFNQSTYHGRVLENSNVSTLVATVYATDKDQDANGRVSYKITSGNTGEAFAVNNKTGVVTVKGSIDREKMKEYTLSIQAEDAGHPSSRKAFADLVITVLDENDSPPLFKESSYEASIEENSEAGKTVVPTIEIGATDADEGANAIVSFSLHGPGSENFLINATTAIIITRYNNSLDRERNDTYHMTLTASDGSNQTTSVPLLVKITDVNDERPRFSQQVYYANISEDAARGTTVRRVTATDLDFLILNKEITYTSTGADAKFYINRATGDIIVDSSLDREFKSYYVLHVTASNIGQNSKEGACQVNITVTDVIDEKPFFDSDMLTYHISENASVGTNVTKLKAHDRDVGDSHTYSLVKSDSSGYFGIDRDTGVITTAKDLDRENMTEHVIYVQATDSVNLTSDNVKIVIKVDDVNDHPPVFTKSFYIEDYREESPKDTSVLTVSAKDADVGVNAEIRFSIVGNATKYVSVDPVTGFIFQADTELDREMAPYFNFTVRATDLGSPALSSEVEVSLTLVDINDNSPAFNQTVYQAYVMENQPIGTSLLVVTATDKDVGTNARLSYGLRGGNFRFNIDQDTGNITTAVRLDREQAGADSYTLTVLAADDAIRSREGTTQVIVTVLDDNDNTPVFSQSNYLFEVSEDVAVGHAVGLVSASDDDEGSNAVITYFTKMENGSELFMINDTTGRIMTAAKLDREKNSSVTFIIIARDKGSPSLESNVTVQVVINDVNDNAPKFQQAFYNVTLPESTFTKTEVETVSASDLDEGGNGQFRYSIESGDPDDQFAINAITGVITLRQKLDHETKAFYNITIAARNLGIPALSGYTNLLVTVSDVDDNAPVFHKNGYTASILENATAGTFVAQVNASDIDADEAHKTILYQIEGGNEQRNFVIGELNGTVFLNWTGDGLDREEVSSYTLTLAAISRVNNTEQKSTVLLVVTILDVNDVTPKFEKKSYLKSVREDTKGLGPSDDRRILTVSAKDDDVGDNAKILYSITKGNEEGVFTLNNATGELLKGKALDREVRDFYSLLVTAADQGQPPLMNQTTINITIVDVNDHIPAIHTQAVFSVLENATVGTLITTINATDRDEDVNAQVKFTIISGNDDERFTLNETNGELRTAKSLDYDQEPKLYKLAIKAQDLGSPPLSSEKTITIKLVNIDDNIPVFVKRQVTLSVGENLPAGAEVGTIAAFDADQAGPIYYYIQSGNSGAMFTLNETTGVLRTTRQADREDSAQFFLYIKSSNVKLDPVSLQPRNRRAAPDAGSNQTNTTQAPLPDDLGVQLVIVEIADQNDNGPRFTKKLYTGGVSEDAKHGSNIIQVFAVDSDEGNNSRISYELLQTKDSEEFSMDRETGWIKAKASYAGKFGAQFVVNVIAKDRFGEEPYFNDTAEVKIYVLTDIQRAVIISGRSPEYIRKHQADLKRVLENITGYIINIDDINYYKDKDGNYDYERTAVLFHAVDPKTNKVVDKEIVIEKIDNNYDKHLGFFNEWKIKEVKAHVDDQKDDEFPVVLAVVISLGILLVIVILIFCCVVFQLRRRQNRKLRAATAVSYGGSRSVNNGTVSAIPTSNMHISEGSNPIWVDPYHNWGMKTDDEDAPVEPSPFYGGAFHIAEEGREELYEAQEYSTDAHEEVSDIGNTGASFSGSRKSSSSTPSPEAYESSPMTERNYFSNSSKIMVTSI